MLRIKVGATSANLCVGFDVLGLALDLYNEFCFLSSTVISHIKFYKRHFNEFTVTVNSNFF